MLFLSIVRWFTFKILIYMVSSHYPLLSTQTNSLSCLQTVILMSLKTRSDIGDYALHPFPIRIYPKLYINTILICPSSHSYYFIQSHTSPPIFLKFSLSPNSLSKVFLNSSTPSESYLTPIILLFKSVIKSGSKQSL